jgi:DNA-binding GntR family transcriptional regulator
MLMETHALVFDKYFRYQMVAFSYRGSEPAAQHRTLLEAALKRDAETAAETLCALGQRSIVRTRPAPQVGAIFR